ncbi:carboxymuconolactone decarboxylase family protein [Rhodoferax sp. U11-2br]|nr:carboxymuconolactone decarboxylase family protein [Rhodoferax sp. U11-2br]
MNLENPNMKLIVAMSSLLLATVSQAQEAPRSAPAPSPDVKIVAPQLDTYTRELLFGDVWKRKELSPRDRSLVTLSSLLANGQSALMTGHLNLALDNGLLPKEISALITHLAFYTGWPNAMSAVGVAKAVFAQRGIQIATPSSEPASLLTPDAESEKHRRAAVAAATSGVAPDLGNYTNEVLFGDLWRQSDLTPRDRSLITMAALIARGQAEQLPFHLNRAMDSGLTREQAGEVVTHLAFYAGWPRAMSAVPVIKAVFESREK